MSCIKQRGAEFGAWVAAKKASTGRGLRTLSTNTSVPGLRYVTDPASSKAVRAAWVSALSLCLTLCVYLVLSLLHRWKTNPATTSLSDLPTSVADLPFPAVTFCPDNKVPRSRYDVSADWDAYNSFKREEKRRKATVLEYFKFRVLFNIYRDTNGFNITETFDIKKYDLADVLPSDYKKIEDTLDFASTFPEGFADFLGSFNCKKFPNQFDQFLQSFRFSHKTLAEAREWFGGLCYPDDVQDSSDPRYEEFVSTLRTRDTLALSLLLGIYVPDVPLTRDHVRRMVMMSTYLKDILSDCTWKSPEKTCENFVYATLTDEGVCFTLNALDPKDVFTPQTDMHQDLLEDVLLVPTNQRPEKSLQRNCTWDAHSGYHAAEEPGNGSFPWRALGRGGKHGLALEFLVKAPELQMDYWESAHHVQMFLHSPAEYPRVKDQHFRVKDKNMVKVTVKPALVSTVEELREGYWPRYRGCFFPEERQLKFFKIYTRTNCEVECLSELIRENCGCIPFYLPRLRSDRTRYCSVNRKDSPCIQDAELEVTKRSMPGRGACNCLPACTELSYDVEVDSSPVQPDPGSSWSMASIYFKNSQFVSTVRLEKYQMVDFISSSSALIGLFTGVSLVTVVEVMFFLLPQLKTLFAASQAAPASPQA